MNFIEKFTEYCDSIINSKKIEIPNKTLPQTKREQEYKSSRNTMETHLKDTFFEEGKNIEEQAQRENKILTLEQLKEMQQIGDNKIKAFFDIADDQFSEL